MVECQLNKKLDYVIDRMPCFPMLKDLEGIVRNFKLKEGLAAETSGGLLISLPKENVDAYVKEMEELGESAWVVGRVAEGNQQAFLAKDCDFFDTW